MYKLGKIPFGQTSPQCVILIERNLVIPFDPANTDYQAYLKWLEEGNTPEPADQPEQQ